MLISPTTTVAPSAAHLRKKPSPIPEAPPFPGQSYAFRGSTGPPRRYFGGPDWRGQRYIGLRTYEPVMTMVLSLIQASSGTALVSIAGDWRTGSGYFAAGGIMRDQAWWAAGHFIRLKCPGMQERVSQASILQSTRYSPSSLQSLSKHQTFSLQLESFSGACCRSSETPRSTYRHY